jgi:hypothetical protein
MSISNEIIGEVTAASTTRFAAVSREVFVSPRFGSLVKVASRPTTIYGVVGYVETASFDSQRRPVAFGLPWEQLAREQPQLVELLQTMFQVAIVAFADEEGLHHWLPPHPPRVHDSVEACDPTEVAAVTDSGEFIRNLAGIEDVPVHEIVAAAIREAALARGRDERFVAAAAHAAADVFKNDYETATAIVKRLA